MIYCDAERRFWVALQGLPGQLNQRLGDYVRVFSVRSHCHVTLPGRSYLRLAGTVATLAFPQLQVMYSPYKPKTEIYYLRYLLPPRLYP